jgi:putative ABC transport system substrate-binding protein
MRNQCEDANEQASMMLPQDQSFAFAKPARLLLLALAIAATCSPAIAQTHPRPKRLGILAPTTCPTPGGPTRATVILLQTLAERGWIDGKTLVVDCVAPGNNIEQLPALAADLVARKPDVLFGGSTQAVRALKQATTEIPIITAASDPLRSGIVTNLAHPEANITGLAPMSFELVAKRTELLKDVLPRFSRLAIISSIGADTTDQEHMQADITTAGHALGFSSEIFHPTTIADIDEIFERVQAEGFDAAYIWPSPFTYGYGSWIAAAALKYRVPTISERSDDARIGILLSYGLDDTKIQQSTADYVDKVLRGAQPADLPLQQPTRLELVINVRSAKALGLTVPQSILLRADEVIE